MNVVEKGIDGDISSERIDQWGAKCLLIGGIRYDDGKWGGAYNLIWNSTVLCVLFASQVNKV